MTHQLNVLSGSTSSISSKLHQKAIRKFDECWVPDVADTPNLSGVLGHTNNKGLNVKYIGPLSRLTKNKADVVYDLMIILSGPEPQRSILERQLLSELQDFKEDVLFVKGKIEKDQTITRKGLITIYNFMKTEELDRAFNQSELILCRSGYTTIMDLAKLEKRAFFIPTPNQYEQEYLAKSLKKSGIAPFCDQKDFVIDKLKDVKAYNGFSAIDHDVDLGMLFNLFEGK